MIGQELAMMNGAMIAGPMNHHHHHHHPMGMNPVGNMMRQERILMAENAILQEQILLTEEQMLLRGRRF